jgi:hypothetical protein
MTASCWYTAESNAALGSNGCAYPTDVPTIFNQYNAAGVSWKAYAQDLGGAQPAGSPTYVTGHDSRSHRHGSRSRRRGLRVSRDRAPLTP